MTINDKNTMIMDVKMDVKIGFVWFLGCGKVGISKWSAFNSRYSRLVEQKMVQKVWMVQVEKENVDKTPPSLPKRFEARLVCRMV